MGITGADQHVTGSAGQPMSVGPYCSVRHANMHAEQNLLSDVNVVLTVDCHDLIICC